MCPVQYYNIMLNCKDKKMLRVRMVMHAKEHKNISFTAECFNTTRVTVYKWLKRFDELGYEGLASMSKRPHNSPFATSEDIKKEVIKAKKTYKNLGAEQIKILANLTPCPDTIRKICKEAGFKPRKRQKKHVTKQNLRDVKKKWDLFQQICVDVKYLDDIPNYYIFMKYYNLPVYQYTARDVTSGLVFWAFAYEKTLTNSVIFIIYVMEHLKAHGVDLSKVTIQTDNGSEFIGLPLAKTISEFTKTILSYKARHSTIPPGAHRFQSDVETFHNLEETDFFDIETFKGMKVFLEKTNTFSIFFNLIRPNTYKENQTPFAIAKKKVLGINKTIALLPPVVLDSFVKDMRNLDSEVKYLYKDVYDVLQNPFI
jgi:transposase